MMYFLACGKNEKKIFKGGFRKQAEENEACE